VIFRAAFNAMCSLLIMTGAGAAQVKVDEDLALALQLASLLQSARSVVASEQAQINNAEIGDKGLSGEVVLARAATGYLERTGSDLAAIPKDSVDGQLIVAMSQAVRQVMDENAGTINHQGIGFKGFVPAVFARLVNENFSLSAKGVAEIKVTAPPDLVRNRKSRPDAWEARVINDYLLSPEWVTGEVYSELTQSEGRPAFRVMVPEYYSEGCLGCHGMPLGEVDITGYPKEGRKLGDLGGVISITLFK
jgi:hypothetical protein